VANLTFQERALLHQVHPAKLAVDISASAISCALLWKHRLAAGLAVHYLAPVVGSAVILRVANVDRLVNTPGGSYVLTHMPPLMVALRLLGDTLMTIGAWRKRPDAILSGMLLVAVGWSHGLLPHRHLRI
jgi:hypothetical protein